MFKFTLNFLKINWSLRDIFILCKQVSELKENIVISMSFLTDDFVFSIPLSTAWCSPPYKCNAFINFHNSPFVVVPLLAKLFIAFVEYYISRRPSARPLKTTYRPSCSRIHITKDTRKYFNLHTKKPLIIYFHFHLITFFFIFFFFPLFLR